MPGHEPLQRRAAAGTSGSSGANSARNTSGWTMLKMTVNGLRSTGRSSRLNTVCGVGDEVRHGSDLHESRGVVRRTRRGAALAQAAAGQLEEDVVEGRAGDLDRRRPAMPAARRSSSRPGDQPRRARRR